MLPHGQPARVGLALGMASTKATTLVRAVIAGDSTTALKPPISTKGNRAVDGSFTTVTFGDHIHLRRPRDRYRDFLGDVQLCADLKPR